MKTRLTTAALAIGLVATLGISSPAASLPVAAGAASATTIVATAPAPVEATTLAAKAKKYKNCKALNKKYKHGVGKTSARDKVRGKSKPVRNFKKSNALYKANKHLDRDRDGVACERR